MNPDLIAEPVVVEVDDIDEQGCGDHDFHWVRLCRWCGISTEVREDDEP